MTLSSKSPFPVLSNKYPVISYEYYKYMVNSLPNSFFNKEIEFEFPNKYHYFSPIKITPCIKFISIDNKWNLVTNINIVNENMESLICPITRLVKDKVVNHIAYNDLNHKYWNIETGEFYTSVTTFIKQFEPEFDSELISTYKAIESLYPIWFQDLKKQRLDMKSLVNKFMANYFSNFELKQKVLDLVSHYRNIWKDNAYESAKKGTEIHKQRESLIYKNKKIELFNTLQNYNKQYTYVSDNIEETIFKKTPFEENLLVKNCLNCFPETLVYSDKYKLAGQVDLLGFDFINDNEHKDFKYIDIYDYKTNKSIDTYNNFETLKEPFNTLDKCNFNIYSLQLSLYGLLLKEMFHQIEDFTLSLNIVHIKEDKDVYIKANDYTDILKKYFMVKYAKK